MKPHLFAIATYGLHCYLVLPPYREEALGSRSGGPRYVMTMSLVLCHLRPWLLHP